MISQILFLSSWVSANVAPDMPSADFNDILQVQLVERHSQACSLESNTEDERYVWNRCNMCSHVHMYHCCSVHDGGHVPPEFTEHVWCSVMMSVMLPSDIFKKSRNEYNNGFNFAFYLFSTDCKCAEAIWLSTVMIINCLLLYSQSHNCPL